eukprot:CAMPEP_0185403554 /NCGR_PEP_ID=MMETSP1364-20130426/92354_1 /TAXON_ID=38817 /ORGANISM="Gephyrocapsa oceanica, Strain RCC1303" /LENGTH=137 /DNA_ID=CAMNT_0028005853 /DNA_START=430 /DNA_END=843 /DNA_ORIENTATION=+
MCMCMCMCMACACVRHNLKCAKHLYVDRGLLRLYHCYNVVLLNRRPNIDEELHEHSANHPGAVRLYVDRGLLRLYHCYNVVLLNRRPNIDEDFSEFADDALCQRHRVGNEWSIQRSRARRRFCGERSSPAAERGPDD